MRRILLERERVSLKEKGISLKKQGFTLIEMLLVIAIIGILAGAVYAMIGDSSDAKTKSALSTAKSIMPYAQECVFKTEALPITPVAGDPICSGSETNWPVLSVTECGYVAGSASTWNIECTLTNTITISCDAQSGECEVI